MDGVPGTAFATPLPGTFTKQPKRLDQHLSGQASVCAPVWTLTPGIDGCVSQATGLAHAVCHDFEEKVTRMRAMWRFLPLRLVPVARGVIHNSESLAATPPPKLVISSGRQSIVSSLYLKKRHGKAVFTVHIQDPMIATSRFDLVIAPKHDRITGGNVYHSMGAIHYVKPQILTAARRQMAGCWPWNSSRPIVTVLLGGPNRYYAFCEKDVDRLVAKLKALTARHDVLLALIKSRRTPDRVHFRLYREFADRHFVWSGSGDNPYFAALATASYLIVTGDSVSMVSEASSTGKPVFVEYLTEKRRAARFRRFNDSFLQAGITRPFDGKLELWDYSPPNDMAMVTELIKDKVKEL